MTEQERAAALADEIDGNDIAVWVGGVWRRVPGTANAGLVVSALRAYGQQPPADLREAVIKTIEETATCRVEHRLGTAYVSNAGDCADAVLALLPQTQAASDVQFDGEDRAVEIALDDLLDRAGKEG